ncbi:hypothetical protein BC628DRAFT_1307797 [Trametes gibbosa]|uniref:Needs CLA4 to survive protein 3 n=1 Tax=Trametes gibbosa TaxID=160864 RepID=A0A6G6FQM0_9APHY|nr:hypothetical protein BC628DRAFT_1307797 [Trametes gibbosa]QIE48527.1 hypothetical protein [Trametes gibbosa]
MASVEPQPQLPLGDYRRYGRQMILDGFGLQGQLRLHQASVVVVGAGGLGCPALQYLAAAGVGTLGVIDHDIVEISNLQRQVLHSEARVGMPKALSAAEAIKQINSRVQVNPIDVALSPANARELLAPYDLILDCTDNLPTRYLLSDTAVTLGLPLVSGAAQQFDGQLCTYNLPLKMSDKEQQENGPCFRCLFPKPPAPELAGSCEELGVLGIVTGIIGNLQALEAVKIITGLHDGRPSLLMFSALATPPFRSIRLRARKASCPACGNEGEKIAKIEEKGYIAFCGGERPDWVSRGLVEGGSRTRVCAKELRDVLNNRQRSVCVLDVRPRTEFGICHLPGSINVPIKEFLTNPTTPLIDVANGDDGEDVYVVCRLGNDSQLAVDALQSVGWAGVVKDLVGGLRAWAKDVDDGFPVY